MKSNKKVKRLLDLANHPLVRTNNKVLALFVAGLVGTFAILDTLAIHPPVNLQHADGTLVKLVEDRTPYLIEDNKLVPMTAAAMQTRGYTAADVKPAADGDEHLKIAPALPLAAGTFYTEKGRTFLIDESNGQYERRTVPDTSVLQKLGYSKSEVWYLAPDDKAALPADTGPDFKADNHPNGTLITGGGKLYVINDGQRQLVPSAAVLQSWGLTNWPPKFATAQDMNLPEGSNLPFREGTLVRENSDYYIIQNNGTGIVKNKVVSELILPNLGYDPSRALIANSSDLPPSSNDSYPKSERTKAIVSVMLKQGQDGNSIIKQYKDKYGAEPRHVFKNWVSLSLPTDKVSGLQKDPSVIKVQGLSTVQSICIEVVTICGTGIAVPPSQPPAPAPAPAPAPSPSPSPAPTPLPSAPVITPPPGIPYTDVQPSVTGNPAVGSTLTVSSPGGWNDPSASISYQWRRCGLTCTNIPGATSSSYTITTSDVGFSVQLAVTASNSGGSNVAYDPGTPAIPAPNSSPSPSPSPIPATPNIPAAPVIKPPANIPYSDALPGLAGNTIVGSTLTADPGIWSDSNARFAYQWRRCSLTCTNIPGVTGTTYVLTPADSGYSIQIAVTATNAGGSNTAYSSGTNVVSFGQSPSSPSPTTPAPVIKPPTNIPYQEALPTFTGNAQVGQTLTLSSPGIWSPSPAGYTYQWRQCLATCSNIAGATGTNYFISADKAGYAIQLAVTAFTSGGSNTAFSSPSSAVTIQQTPVVYQGNPLTPVNNSLPVISGTPAVGSFLSASTGGWSGTISTYSYQWQWCFAGNGPYPDGVRCYDVPGAWNQNFIVSSDLLGKLLRVKVTANGPSSLQSAYSSMTAAVTGPSTTGGQTITTPSSSNAKPLIQVSTPSVSGSPYIGSTLSLFPGTWNNYQRLTYIWQRCPNANIPTAQFNGCTNIGGANGLTYTVTSNDTGHKLRAEVDATSLPFGGTTITLVSFSNTTAVISNQLSPTSKPSVTISANPNSNVSLGSKVTLNWSSLGTSGSTPCTASGAWSGTKPASGTEQPPYSILANTKFTLTCSNNNGSTSASVSVTVNQPAPPQDLPYLRIGWTPSMAHAGSKVAIVDTGVSAVGRINLTGGMNCYAANPSSSPTTDLVGHGTTIASIIGSDFGIAPGTPIVPIKVADSRTNISSDDVACGIERAVQSGASIINVSIAGVANNDAFKSDDCSANPVARAICDAYDAGRKVVVADGNDAADTANYWPAKYSKVLSVGAISDWDGEPGHLGTRDILGCSGAASDDVPAGYSNYFTGDTGTNRLAAPGCFDYYNTAGQFIDSGNGTSFATALVSGVYALNGNAGFSDDPSYTYTDPGNGHFYGHMVHL